MNRIQRHAHLRLRLLATAEALLLSEGPVIPIYHYSESSLIKPYVAGIHSTVLDVHPFKRVFIDHDWRTKAALADPAAGAGGRS